MRTAKPALDYFMTRLHERDPDLAHQLPLKGGLRGLFDTASHEYKSTTLDQKIETFVRLQRARMSLLTMVEPAFVEEMAAFSYPESEARRCFTDGVCVLLDYLIQGA